MWIIDILYSYRIIIRNICPTLFRNNVIIIFIFIEQKTFYNTECITATNHLRDYLSQPSNQQLLGIADRESCYRLVDRRRTNKGSLDTLGRKRKWKRSSVKAHRKIIPPEFLVVINSYKLQIQFAEVPRR